MNADGVLVVTPARNEAESLAGLHRRLVAALDGAGISWRWLIVDDASTDETPETVARLAASDGRVGGIRFALNAGSHLAILAGFGIALRQADIGAVAVLAGDLQDPPEALPALIAALQAGAVVAFASRSRRPGVPLARRGAARLLHVGIRVMLPRSGYPWSGADMGVFGRPAIAAVVADPRPLGSIFVRIARLGLPAAVVPVEKAPRRHGRSGWSPGMLVRTAITTFAEACGLPLLGGRSIPRIIATNGWAAAAGKREDGLSTIGNPYSNE